MGYRADGVLRSTGNLVEENDEFHKVGVRLLPEWLLASPKRFLMIEAIQGRPHTSSILVRRLHTKRIGDDTAQHAMPGDSLNVAAGVEMHSLRGEFAQNACQARW
jgi:hypothetical protein